MVSSLLARIVIVTIGTLYPGYQSYKSLKTADLPEICRNIRYWIVFSVFIACETITDIFLSWFPFYYWFKIIFVFWMISPTGSKYLYKRLLHPFLKDREKEIDEMIEQTKQQGYTALASLTNRGVRYASNLLVNSAILGQEYMGNRFKRSHSVSDIDSRPRSAPSKRPTIVQEEDEEIDGEFTRITEEDIKRLPKSKSERKHQKSNSQQNADVLPSLPKPRRTPPETQTSTKKTGVAYSSSESAHLGTISKRSANKMRETVAENRSQNKTHSAASSDQTN